MPTKQELMNLGSASAVVDFAHVEFGVSKTLKTVTLAGGVKEVRLKKADSSTFSGQGATNLEAVADAVSKEFPA
jgi:hypothetical protein